MQAGAIGDRGQVYVLDMGEPVKIDDLARQMIQLSGRTQEQIGIIYVGSRAGEKLHEVLWNDGEEDGPTAHPKITRAARPPVDAEWLKARARRAGAARGRGRHARGDDEAEDDRRGARRAANRCSKTRCTDGS